MKRSLILFFSLILSLLSFFAISCASDGAGCNGDTKDQQGIKLSSEQLTLNIGDGVTLQVTNDKNIDYVVEWSSENDTIATVDKEGYVLANGLGSTNIVAKVEGYEPLKCKVEVAFGEELPILLFENEQDEYVIGKTDTILPFTPYISYKGIKYYDMQTEYSSSDENIISFDDVQKGLINIKGEGSVTISIKAKWRNATVENSPLLQKTVKVTTVDNVFFFVNDRQYNEISLYATDYFYNQSYINSMEFKPSVKINDTLYTDVDIVCANRIITVNKTSGRLTARAAGEEKIILKFTDGNTTYSSSINVKVNRVEVTHGTKINYFSSYTGTFKDENCSFLDETLTNLIFGSNDVSGLKAYQGSNELVVDNGRILGAKEDFSKKYDSQFILETPQVSVTVDLTVASLFIQKAEDLKNFEVKFTERDDPSTHGKDETKFTFVDGYCEVMNNIDATGVSIDHEALVQYDFVNKDGETKKVTIDPAFRYNKEQGVGKAGFLGTFNGNGYTIFNLDTSNAGNNNGGLFGYLLGGATIKNVGFENLNISNSSGLAYKAHVPAVDNIRNGAKDALGVRCAFTEFKDVYVKLSEDTTNPKGALMDSCTDFLSGFYNLSNVIIDGTEIVANNGANGGLLFNDATSLTAVHTTRKNVYVISNHDMYCGVSNYLNSQFAISSSVVRGENQANGAALNKHGAEMFASGIKTYKSYQEMISAGNDYEKFADVWTVQNYPIFNTVSAISLKVDGEVARDNKIFVSSATTAKTIAIEDFLTGDNLNIISIDYDNAIFDITNNGIKLLQQSQSDVEIEETIRIIFIREGIERSITVKVVIVPAQIVVSDRIELSQFLSDVSTLNRTHEKITDIGQKIGSEPTKWLTLRNGKPTDLMVKADADKSDVEKSEITVLTKTYKYIFDNVYVYSHVITKASDMNVFARKSNSSALDGFYVLANHIDMRSTGVTHSGITFENDNNVFKGIFDGRGYTITNFKPTEQGLFGKLYSDNNSQAVVRNLAFIAVQSTRNNDFAILAEYINSESDGITAKIENVHVEIANTYLSTVNPTSNYKGLIKSNAQDKYNTFVFKNIFISIDNEEYSDRVNGSSGALLSNDSTAIKGAISQADRSKRFDNVVIIAKQNPITFRAEVGGILENVFGETMYFTYAENDAGKQGLTIDGTNYQTIAENSSAGSYILNNVYRYDNVKDMTDTVQKNKFTSTSFWSVNDGELSWRSKIVIIDPTENEDNFDVDFIN